MLHWVQDQQGNRACCTRIDGSRLTALRLTLQSLVRESSMCNRFQRGLSFGDSSQRSCEKCNSLFLTNQMVLIQQIAKERTRKMLIYSTSWVDTLLSLCNIQSPSYVISSSGPTTVRTAPEIRFVRCRT